MIFHQVSAYNCLHNFIHCEQNLLAICTVPTVHGTCGASRTEQAYHCNNTPPDVFSPDFCTMWKAMSFATDSCAVTSIYASEWLFLPVISPKDWLMTLPYLACVTRASGKCFRGSIRNTGRCPSLNTLIDCT